MSITLEEDGTTLLSGPMPDQPALYGILRRVRDLGLPLVSVYQHNSYKRRITNINFHCVPCSCSKTERKRDFYASQKDLQNRRYWRGVTLLLALVLLLPLNHLFGFHPVYLGFLVVYAVFLLAYDIFCWRTVDVQWKPKMNGLISLNTFFMLVGAAVLLHPAYRPNGLGMLYLLGEITIVFILTIIQIRSLKEK